MALRGFQNRWFSQPEFSCLDSSEGTGQCWRSSTKLEEQYKVGGAGQCGRNRTLLEKQDGVKESG